MTQAIELPLSTERASEASSSAACASRISSATTTSCCSRRCSSFIRDDYGVSYTELGLALTAFNVVSTVLQTPAGFLVDRMSARMILICGLLLGAAAFAVAGLVNSFWVFVAMFAVAGVANTVYHPADYALLSQHVPPAARRTQCSPSTPSPACSATRLRRPTLSVHAEPRGLARRVSRRRRARRRRRAHPRGAGHPIVRHKTEAATRRASESSG